MYITVYSNDLDEGIKCFVTKLADDIFMFSRDKHIMLESLSWSSIISDEYG